MTGRSDYACWLGLGLSALLLAGCQDSRSAILAGRSASDTPIALESIEGVPEAARGQLTTALAREAGARNLTLVSASSPARYRVRGYLAAQTTGSETTVSYVWDLFDEAKRRAGRVAGESRIGSGSGEPWERIDQAALARIAAGSLDGMAGFLSGEPSAVVPQVSAAPTSGSDSEEEEAPPMSYAPAVTR